MRVLLALLCEDAIARDDGSLDAHGIFHHLFAPGFPAQQDRMVLVVVLEWEDAEAGRNNFRIDLLDTSGSPVLTINGHTDVSPRREREPPPRTQLVMPLENVVFPAAGTYEFELHLGEARQKLVLLHLIEHPEAF